MISNRIVTAICVLIGLGFALLIGFNIYDQGMFIYHYGGNPSYLVTIVNNGWLLPATLVISVVTGIGTGLSFYLTYHFSGTALNSDNKSRREQ